MRIAFVCPTYNAAELEPYTLRAVQSFFEKTPEGIAIVIDDASKSWSHKLVENLEAIPRSPQQKLRIYHFATWGGLTRSWNRGLRLAKEMKADYVAVSNNDVIFTQGWQHGLIHAIHRGYALIGPVSNAPGLTAEGLADIGRYKPDYKLDDDQGYLDAVAGELSVRFKDRIISAPVNGFFQFASMSRWYAGRFDSVNYYRPRNDIMPSGRRNKTPLMTGNEDELQYRWKKLGLKTAVVPSSFIFHYRSVARGPKYQRGLWYRINNEKAT